MQGYCNFFETFLNKTNVKENEVLKLKNRDNNRGKDEKENNKLFTNPYH